MSENKDSLKGFILDLKKFYVEIVPQKIVTIQKALAFKLFDMILRKTPVDKGFLRGAWTISVGTVSTANAGRISSAKKGQAPITEEIQQMRSILNQIARTQVGTVIYFSNAMPYVAKVEFGGYPNPAKKGTYVKKGSRLGGVVGPGWVIRTANGFSTQAPQGMVQVSIQEVQNWIDTELTRAVIGPELPEED